MKPFPTNRSMPTRPGRRHVRPRRPRCRPAVEALEGRALMSQTAGPDWTFGIKGKATKSGILPLPGSLKGSLLGTDKIVR